MMESSSQFEAVNILHPRRRLSQFNFLQLVHQKIFVGAGDLLLRSQAECTIHQRLVQWNSLSFLSSKIPSTALIVRIVHRVLKY